MCYGMPLFLDKIIKWNQNKNNPKYTKTKIHPDTMISDRATLMSQMALFCFLCTEQNSLCNRKLQVHGLTMECEPRVSLGFSSTASQLAKQRTAVTQSAVTKTGSKSGTGQTPDKGQQGECLHWQLS